MKTELRLVSKLLATCVSYSKASDALCQQLVLFTSCSGFVMTETMKERGVSKTTVIIISIIILFIYLTAIGF
jgi:hypothetical protein